MQDSTNTPPLNPPVPPVADPVPPVADPVPPAPNDLAPVESADAANSDNDSLVQVIKRINEGDNILVALSKNPSVDELTAAIALTMYLDKYGKHATAIFSGKTPNAIKFLKPEETLFENTDSLQDFIIALNKEKADHLRYKLEGDFVKVYITPYKAKIDEHDLEFSYGEYNVDLVVALNVPTRDGLDAALSEYGRIMHDATAININAGPPQNFGDLEWGDPSASSVSEMIYQLITRLDEGESLIDKSMANALLAGIISATDRFSNDRTSSAAMSVASHLLDLGADQKMIVAEISEGERSSSRSRRNTIAESEEVDDDGASISISHDDAQKPEEKDNSEAPKVADMDLTTALDSLMLEPTSQPDKVSDTTPFSEPHAPTSVPNFSVAPPSAPEAVLDTPNEPSIQATTPNINETQNPVEVPSSIDNQAPVSTSSPTEAPISTISPQPGLPQMPQASSNLDALLPPPPPPPTMPNAILPNPSAPNVDFNPQISEPSMPTPSASPNPQISESSMPTPSIDPNQFSVAPQVAPAASSPSQATPVEQAPNPVTPTPQTTTPNEAVPSISSFQIPDTGLDEGIFGNQNSN